MQNLNFYLIITAILSYLIAIFVDLWRSSLLNVIRKLAGKIGTFADPVV